MCSYACMHMHVCVCSGVPEAGERYSCVRMHVCICMCVYAVVYLKLENITRGFSNPSVMDIKVGSVTYDHEADDAKIARELAKSPALRDVAFQIVGIRVGSIL